MTPSTLADPSFDGAWRDDPVHRRCLLDDARRQLAFFVASLRADGGFDTLDIDGSALPRAGQELHLTTRMVHSYALGRGLGHPGADRIIDAGMGYIWTHHRDADHGGYVWAADGQTVTDGRKLAYGHVFVLLAASSAKEAGHPDADRLLADIAEVIETRFWDEERGLLQEEYASDWAPISDYRGLNANMHGAEAMLAAHEATGDRLWLDRAGRILGFFAGEVAATHDWRLPEHFTRTWEVDWRYEGDPMFRPKGTTPGHSLEIARLVLQHWDLAGRTDAEAPRRARRLAERALEDAWLPDGGLAYTLDYDGRVRVADRYWWPVAEGIAAVAALQKAEVAVEDEAWYRQLWTFAANNLIDADRGGWFPELDDTGTPIGRQFIGKPDIYHAIQADLLPILPKLSRPFGDLRQLTP